MHLWAQFAVEIDEKGHNDKNQNEKNERQTKIENHSDCNFFQRINPDAEDFDIFLEISEIRNYVTQLNKEKIKEQEEKIKDQENEIKEQEEKIKKQKSKFAKELLSYEF